MPRDEVLPLKVSSTASPTAVAGALLKALEDDRDKDVVIRGIGAGAVSNAVKAIAIARARTLAQGEDLYALPAFETIQGRSGEDISAVTLTVGYFEDEDDG